MTLLMHGPRALQFLLASFADRLNREQAQVIDYQAEVIRVLKEQFGGKIPRLTDAPRRRLTANGKPLCRRLLDKVAAIVRSDTILRWHRRLIAEHHTYVASRLVQPFFIPGPATGFIVEPIWMPSNSKLAYATPWVARQLHWS
tara:strand:+ start:615 stop:1043 length:429 start_codon:yes stop_codon:yes gene_type:complete